MLTVYGSQQTRVAPNIMPVIPMLKSRKNSTKSSSAATSFYHKAKPLPQISQTTSYFSWASQNTVCDEV